VGGRSVGITYRPSIRSWAPILTTWQPMLFAALRARFYTVQIDFTDQQVRGSLVITHVVTRAKSIYSAYSASAHIIARSQKFRPLTTFSVFWYTLRVSRLFSALSSMVSGTAKLISLLQIGQNQMSIPQIINLKYQQRQYSTT
jgi:hypothetical protein